MHLRVPAVTPSELISAPPLLLAVLNVWKYVLPICSPMWLLFTSTLKQKDLILPNRNYGRV